jgi:hypothetical protein
MIWSKRSMSLPFSPCSVSLVTDWAVCYEGMCVVIDLQRSVKGFRWCEGRMVPMPRNALQVGLAHSQMDSGIAAEK